MELQRPAAAGEVESSDCQVTIEKGNGTIDLSIQSSVINQYGNQIRRTVLDTLRNLGVHDAKVTITDKGALDYVIRARVEAAVFRSVGQLDNLPWGGAIRP